MQIEHTVQSACKDKQKKHHRKQNEDKPESLEYCRIDSSSKTKHDWRNRSSKYEKFRRDILYRTSLVWFSKRASSSSFRLRSERSFSRSFSISLTRFTRPWILLSASGWSFSNWSSLASLAAMAAASSTASASLSRSLLLNASTHLFASSSLPLVDSSFSRHLGQLRVTAASRARHSFSSLTWK